MLIDRYIFYRFVTNFAILFTLLYVFATAIDLMHALDKFAVAAAEMTGADAGFVAKSIAFVRLVFDFQGPRFFQFYSYLHGLVAVGAMAFTLVQLGRHREIIAMLSAGLSMQRISMPFVVGMFALSALQIVNQEVFLPRVAPLLLRDHGAIGQRGIDEFPVLLTPDGNGNLLQAPKFDPATGVLVGPTFLERDDRGRTQRRVTAESARWTRRTLDDGTRLSGWELEVGRGVVLQPGQVQEPGTPRGQLDVPFIETDLSPEILLVHRYAQFAAMLNLRQINQMLDTPGVSNRNALLRYGYSRFSAVLINVLVMWLSLPTFLVREPCNPLKRAALCAAVSMPALLGSTVFMMVDIPGIPPALGVFLPVVVLIPIVLAQWTYVKT